MGRKLEQLLFNTGLSQQYLRLAEKEAGTEFLVDLIL